MNSIACDVLVIGAGLPALVATAAGMRRSDGCFLPGGEIRRIVRRGRTISAVVVAHGEIAARFLIDASARLLPTGPTAFEPIAGREYVDTIAVADGPAGRHALPYRAALVPGIDNALVIPTGLPPRLALAAAHAVGTAAALLAASGQPAGQLDPATLREKLREAGALL